MSKYWAVVSIVATVLGLVAGLGGEVTAANYLVLYGLSALNLHHVLKIQAKLGV